MGGISFPALMCVLTLKPCVGFWTRTRALLWLRSVPPLTRVFICMTAALLCVMPLTNEGISIAYLFGPLRKIRRGSADWRSLAQRTRFGKERHIDPRQDGGESSVCVS